MKINNYKNEYGRWLLNVTDEDIKSELLSMNDASVEDAFYCDLVFGTGGLRGIIGAGTNRMNVYTVRKASQGLANYINETVESPSVVIGYDSRIKSKLFAKVAASVFVANGIKVFIWSELVPVPMVSYAVRVLKATAGIMITASHNPSKYNGYKVYGYDGCQITTEVAEMILSKIDDLDVFVDVKSCFFDEELTKGNIVYIDSVVADQFIEKVKEQSVLFGEKVDRDVAVVYSPLNGTGLKPVTRVLSESGFTNVTIVKEQREPNGNFPTCPFPNPEIPQAMELGLKYCKEIGADLLIATDPDCDRCGIAVMNEDENEYKLLTGNEVGLLLLDFICSQRVKHNKMPNHPVFIKTIVTIDLAEKIAAHYGVETINVLTGFKFIGEIIGHLEALGRECDFICGFEESYGYLTGAYVRDKDAVNAALMICEMFVFYRSKGINLIDRLQEIYSLYGYCLNTLHCYEFEGVIGNKKITNIMNYFYNGLTRIANYDIVKTEDYRFGLNGLPKSDVLKLFFDYGSLVVRPSGTEPKLKLYISVTAREHKSAEKIEKQIITDLDRVISSICC